MSAQEVCESGMALNEVLIRYKPRIARQRVGDLRILDSKLIECLITCGRQAVHACILEENVSVALMNNGITSRSFLSRSLLRCGRGNLDSRNHQHDSEASQYQTYN